MKTTSYYKATSLDRYYYDAKFSVTEIRWLESTMNRVCSMNENSNLFFATNDNDKKSSDRLRVHIKEFQKHLNQLFQWIELRRRYTFYVPQRAAFTLAEIEFMSNVVINETLEDSSFTHKPVPKEVYSKLSDFRAFILMRLSPEHRSYACQS